MFARNPFPSPAGTYGYVFATPGFRANRPISRQRASRIIKSWFHQTVLMVDNNPAVGTTSSAQRIRTTRQQSTSTQELESVYFSSYDILVKSARLLVDDLSSAADVVQEAFVKAIAAQPRFTDDDALAYMKTAVMNQARSALRKRGVSRKHLSIVPVEDTYAPVKETVELPIDASVVHSALAALSQRQRECVMLFHTYSMSHREIAAELEISEGSVKQHLSRGLKNLSAALEGAR